MAHFIGVVEGAGAAVSRTGSARSGITAVARGWELGANVRGRHAAGGDEFDLEVTGGTNGGWRVDVGVVRADEDGRVVLVLTETQQEVVLRERA